MAVRKTKDQGQVSGKGKKVKKWRRLYVYADQYQFGEIIKAMRKHGYRALPESRVFDLMNKGL